MSNPFSYRSTITLVSLAAVLGLGSGCASDDPDPRSGRHSVTHHVTYRREVNDVDHSARNAGIGTGLGVFALNMLAGNSIAGSAMNGALAGGTTYGLIKSYQASQVQVHYVYVHSETAVHRTVVRRNLESSRSRVVAVRVPKRAGSSSSSTVMLVSADTGKPLSEKAYELEKRPSDGETIRVEGRVAIYSGDAPL